MDRLQSREAAASAEQENSRQLARLKARELCDPFLRGCDYGHCQGLSNHCACAQVPKLLFQLLSRTKESCLHVFPQGMKGVQSCEFYCLRTVTEDTSCSCRQCWEVTTHCCKAMRIQKLHETHFGRASPCPMMTSKQSKIPAY